MRIKLASCSRTAIAVVIVVRELSPIRTFVDLLLAVARSDPDLHLVVIGRIVEFCPGNGVGIRDDKENFVRVERAGAARPIIVPYLTKPDGGASLAARLDVVGTIVVSNDARAVVMCDLAVAGTVNHLFALFEFRLVNNFGFVDEELVGLAVSDVVRLVLIENLLGLDHDLILGPVGHDLI